MTIVEQELIELRRWKAEALEVERSWDVQKIGKMIGVELGGNIRAAIEPYITSLRQRVKELEESQHDENCDSRDIIIPGKPCNCYVKYKQQLATAQAAFEAIFNTGHNDDCLFCGFKDKIAIKYIQQAKKAGK
jgi:hypothetical protein